MPRFDGAAARKLDFDEIAQPPARALPPAGMRLTPRLRAAARPDRYRQLDLRRRRAQIAARHLLDLAEER